MHWISTGALFVGVLLAGLTLLVFAAPLRFAASARTNSTHPVGSALVSWGAGLARLEISSRQGLRARLAGFCVYQRERLPLFGAPKGSRETTKTESRSRGIERRALWNIAARSVRSVRLRARVGGRIGTGDPAATANLFGVIAALRRWTPELDSRGLELDWIDPVLELSVELTGRLWPAQFVWIASSEAVKSWLRSRDSRLQRSALRRLGTQGE